MPPFGNGQITATQSAAPPHYRQLDTMLKFWDVSEHPTVNDRKKKLGNFWATPVAAVCDFNPVTNRARTADGMVVPNTERSIAPCEPDNHVLRIHDPKGRDRVWALRMVTDHDNKHDGSEHRSTMVIDERNRQLWAWSADQWWVQGLGAKVIGKELVFNGAGFLSSLCEFGGTATGGGVGAAVATGTGAQQSGPTRGCLMLNVSKRGGHYTDGIDAAQLWHVLHISPTSTGTSTVAGVAGDTVNRKQGTARGDMQWDFGGQLAHLALTGAGAEADVPVSGAFFIGAPAPKPPGAELADDPLSNQTMLSRKLLLGLRPWVKIPRPDTPTGNGRKMPPTFPGLPGGTVTATAQTSGAFDVTRYKASAATVGSYIITEIPRTIPSVPTGWGMTVEVNYITPAGGFGHGGVDVRLDYCAVAIGASAAPGAVTGSIPMTLAQAGSQALGVALFHVPYADIVGAKGGKLTMGFYRLPAPGGDALDVIATRTTFGPEYA